MKSGKPEAGPETAWPREGPREWDPDSGMLWLVVVSCSTPDTGEILKENRRQ